MALDEALLHSVASGNSMPVLRFYRWCPATVTLGYAQSVTTDIDLNACRDAGLDIVRRSTGGRAVLHDYEVTYAVLAPFNSEPFGSTILDCYRLIAEALLKALNGLGLPAQLVPGKLRGGPQNSAKAVCFSVPSQYELVIEGCKVAGSAQKRHGKAFLQHGSIPLEINLELLGQALRADSNATIADSLQTVGWLNRYGLKDLKVEQVEVALANAFAEHIGIEWKVSEPTSAELGMAREICVDKFGNQNWNLKR